MQLKPLVAAGLLLAGTSALADGPVHQDGGMSGQKAGERALVPRHISRKAPFVRMPRDVKSTMIVKFVDSARVRPAPSGNVRSLSRTDLSAVTAVCSQYGLRMTPMFEQSADVLAAIEDRAARRSGRAQPDLAGMMWVQGPLDRLEEAANALHALDTVEYAEFMPELALHSADQDFSWQVLEAATRGLAGGGGGTPSFCADQLQNVFYDDVDDSGVWEPDGVDGIPGNGDDEDFIGGLDINAMHDMGQFLIDNDLTDPGWDNARNGARGATVNIGIVEFSCFNKHEDLDIIVEPGQRLLPPELNGFPNVNHGTATLGEVVAVDHGLPGPDRFIEGDDAELGIIGLVPEAQGWFFPTVSTTGGNRLPSAIASALTLFDYGDVLSFSIGFPGRGPLITVASLAQLMAIATDIGINTVMSAGNDCLNLDESPYPEFDTGSIVVGAGLPEGSASGFDPYARLGFSNHFNEAETTIDPWQEERRVWVQAWGENVCTLGYGDLFDPTGDPNRWYTNTFNGTSSAAPMIAGLVASLQGLSKMYYGIPLGVVHARTLVCSNFNLFGQEGRTFLIPEVGNVSGTAEPPDGDPCDPGTYDKEEDPDIIGGFPIPVDYFGTDPLDTILEVFFNENRFGDTILEDHMILRGELIVGNLNSLKTADGVAMLLLSEYTTPGTMNGTDPYPAPTYFFTGEMTDVAVTGKAIVPDNVRSFFIQTVLAAILNSTGFQGCEAFNVQTGQWDWLGIGAIGPFYGSAFYTPRIPRYYVNMDNGNIMVRVWIITFGFGSDQFEAAYDMISIRLQNSGFGGGV